MKEALVDGGGIVAAVPSVDGSAALRRGVDRARRRRAIGAWLAVLPAFLFVLVTFFLPISLVLYRAVEGGSARHLLPHTAAELSRWDGAGMPGVGAYRALADDLRTAETAQVAEVARELNTRVAGYRSLLLGTKRGAANLPATTGADLTALDERWGDASFWRTLRAATRPITPYYVLAALDLRQGETGSIERAPEERRIYLDFLARTLWICLVVTVACAAIGYPIAYFISQAPPALEKLLLFLLLIPFWTSVLVRTAAWVIVLQQNGLVNAALRSAGLISDPLTLVYNRFGVYVAMIHVLLPFMVLPIYSVMKAIPRNLLPAAASLGARPLAAFREVYLPLSLPGLSAGALMTFVLGLGYYVTPALVGGANDQMQSGLIARFALDEANWAMASAVALVLLAVTGATFAALRWLLGAGSTGWSFGR